eukprot:1071552-Pelagomonas_calceolata.AAC.1
MNLGLTKQKAKSLASKLRNHAIQRLATIINTKHALCLRGGFWGGGCWARGGGGWEKETPGVQEHGEQPSRSPLY